MRIFSRCFVLALFALTVPAYALVLPAPTARVTDKSTDSLTAIERLTKEIMAANPEYPDPYKVPIGVLIHMPVAEGPQVFYKTEPWQYGKMGCYWHIAVYHLYGKQLAPPEPMTVATDTMTAATEFSVRSFQEYLFFFTAVVLIITIITLVVLSIMHHFSRVRNRRENEFARDAEEKEFQRIEQVMLADKKQTDCPTDAPVIAGSLSEKPTNPTSGNSPTRDEPQRSLRRNSPTHGDKFSVKVVITTKGAENPATRQVVEVTADRFVTEMILPDGSKITF